MPQIAQTGLEFAADLVLGAFELLLGRGLLVALLAAAGLVAGLEAGLLVVGVGLFKSGLVGPGRLLMHATFLHLVLITVLVLVEPFLEVMLPLPLREPDPVLLDQSLDFAGGLAVV